MTDIVTTSKGIQENGNACASVGMTIIIFAGLKIWIFGAGIWSILLIVAGLFFMYKGITHANVGYQAELDAVNSVKEKSR
jgi:uncharacterized membrane protein